MWMNLSNEVSQHVPSIYRVILIHSRSIVNVRIISNPGWNLISVVAYGLLEFLVSNKHVGSRLVGRPQRKKKDE